MNWLRLSVLGLLLSGCVASGEQNSDGAQVDAPSVSPIAEPPASKGATRAWATNYYVHLADEVSDGVPLRSTSGATLSRLRAKDWCLAAIEGTAIVAGASGNKTLNYASVGPDAVVDCRPFLPASSRTKAWAIALGKTRWSEVDAPYGLGTGGYKLVPFKTLAVDRKTFPIGTALYIPEAKGVRYQGPSGTQTHDGYFLAADVGGAIKGNHVDVFTGTGANKVFSFVKSNAASTFDIVVVTDPAVTKQLRALHR